MAALLLVINRVGLIIPLLSQWFLSYSMPDSLHRFWECYYDYLSSLMTQIPFYPQHPFMSLAQFSSDSWHCVFSFRFFLGHTIVVCFQDNLVWNQTFLWRTPGDIWISCVLRIGGNQGPARTILTDIPPNLWKKWTRKHHTRLHIQKKKKKILTLDPESTVAVSELYCPPNLSLYYSLIPMD